MYIMEPTTTTLAISPNPVLAGELVRLTATVTADAGPEAGVPTGTITFTGNVLGLIAVVPIDPSTGTAEFSFNAPAISDAITATYSGDGLFQSSFDAAVLTVSPAFPFGRIEIISGNYQKTLVETSFAEPLVVRVVDAAGAPVPGAGVFFNSPLAGPDATFNGLSSDLQFADANGIATSVIPVANEIGGSYSVIAAVPPFLANAITLTNFLVCLAFDTEILMGDNTWTPIQDIKRGDIVMGDPDGKNQYKVAKLNVITVTDANKPDVVVFQEGSLGKDLPRRKLIMTGDHTIIFNDKRIAARRFQNNPKVTRYLGGKISKKGVDDETVYLLKDILPDQNGRLDPSDIEFKETEFEKYNFYDLQFETKGTYVAEGIIVKSRCPNSPYTPLPKELYFDQSLYKM